MSARMLASFVDGTKTMVELAALANATGLRPDCPGLHGPQANLADLVRTFVPESDGGILRNRGVVDYAIGDVAPGVFLVVTTPSEAVRRDLAYLKAGDGPYYLLHRPYHLASLEAPLSVARAVLNGEVTMAAVGAPLAECVAVAKRDLRAGEVLDGIGGDTVYGLTDAASSAAAAGAVPIGVSHGARVRRDVPRGTTLTEDDVALAETATIVQLRRLQDVMVRNGTLPQVAPAAMVGAGAAGTSGGTAC
jgi:predicted homoserine dehydrogenase-like protein